jgi:hypothetical protein
LSRKASLSSYHSESCAPTLFHTSLGKVNALSGSLHLHNDWQDGDPAENTSANLAALLHERHHWVQSLATDAGIFHMLLLEMQASVVASRIPVQELTADQFPLLTRFSHDEQTLHLWERIEAVRRAVFGCRKPDMQHLLDRRISPFPHHLVGLMEDVLFGVLDTPPDNPVRIVWESMKEMPVEDGVGLPALVSTSAGSLLGARHLMECSARIAESIKLSSDWIRRKTGDENYDLSPLFTGIYGEAITAAQESSGKPLNLITLAYACDFALCSAYPPVLPPTRAVMNLAWLPGARFVRAMNELADFDDSESVNFQSPEDVRTRIRQMDEFMTDRTGYSGSAVLVACMEKLGIPAPAEVATCLFTVEDGSIPHPATPGSKLRYWMSLASEACRLRTDNPEFVVFPAATYLKSRPEYHSMFDRIQPPLLSYGNRGISGTRDIDGWLEFFLAAAFEYEIGRGIVYSNLRQLAGVMVDYYHGLSGYQGGPDAFEYLVRNACRDAPFTGRLLDEVRALSFVG